MTHAKTSSQRYHYGYNDDHIDGDDDDKHLPPLQHIHRVGHFPLVQYCRNISRHTVTIPLSRFLKGPTFWDFKMKFKGFLRFLGLFSSHYENI